MPSTTELSVACTSGLPALSPRDICCGLSDTTDSSSPESSSPESSSPESSSPESSSPESSSPESSSSSA
ncbi:hypothetical protein F0H33_14890 [Xanthomonas translucens pv. undulosa]|nr:hypothetical protein F0H33_14890 [Xanthomonas translucens pv. undulosa]